MRYQYIRKANGAKILTPGQIAGGGVSSTWINRTAEAQPLLTYLNCYYCDISPTPASPSSSKWTNLEYLNVRGTEVTSRVFEHVSHMKNLRTLDVGTCLEPLTRLPKLRRLNLWQSARIDDKAALYLLR